MAQLNMHVPGQIRQRRDPATPEVRQELFLGLDLGQSADYTALTVVEKHEPLGESGFPDTSRPSWYHIRHLERYELGTRYTDVVRRVGEMLQAPALNPPGGPAPELVVDATGVGAAVVDMFAEAALGPIAIWIHGGDTATRDEKSPFRSWRVPKRELVGTLQVLLQSGRLKAARTIPLIEVLVREMENFKVKINVASGHDSYEAWREGDHDDMVLSAAVALWYADRVHHSPGPIIRFFDD